MGVSRSGVCSTDKHTYRGETKQYTGTPHERELAYPPICGHENVGVVEAVGGRGAHDAEGRPLRPGDRVVPGANVPGGRCYFCLGRFPYSLRAPRRLRQQPHLRRAALPLRRLGRR